MNEFRGTRGKWEVVAQNETGALITGMNGNESICTVWGSVDEFEANAKLIESAPEMLEMLKIMGDALLELMNHQDGWEDDYENLKQLIKKATEL